MLRHVKGKARHKKSPKRDKVIINAKLMKVKSNESPKEVPK